MNPQEKQQFDDMIEKVNTLYDLFFRMSQNDKFYLDRPLTLRDTNIKIEGTVGSKIGENATDKIGFWGKAPAVRPTALTTDLTHITHTAPATPDYAIQDFTQTTPWGFASHDEANTVLKVILNLQTRIGELETKLQSVGLLT